MMFYTNCHSCRYIGDFQNNKKNGNGILYFANGDKRVGVWKDDKLHGQATYYYSGGRCTNKSTYKSTGVLISVLTGLTRRSGRRTTSSLRNEESSEAAAARSLKSLIICVLNPRIVLGSLNHLSCIIGGFSILFYNLWLN